MVKEDKDVISEFNKYVNMTASELEKWLKSEDSSSAGQSKDGSGGGESVGQDSGHKIVEILKANPDKDPEKYTDEQIQHMRKVASYCKRHLAQESSGNKEKDAEDVKKTKSYISLKNWGHDFLKAQGKASGSANGTSKSDSQKEEEEEEKGDGAEDEGEGRKAGDKRKTSDGQDGSNKKRETGKKANSPGQNATEDEGDENGGDNQNGAAEKEEGNGEKESAQGEDAGGKPARNGPEKGETVSWNWGSGNPQGKVLDVKEDKATITTKRGNEVSRDGNSEDPAVILDTGKFQVMIERRPIRLV